METPLASQSENCPFEPKVLAAGTVRLLLSFIVAGATACASAAPPPADPLVSPVPGRLSSDGARVEGTRQSRSFGSGEQACAVDVWSYELSRDYTCRWKLSEAIISATGCQGLCGEVADCFGADGPDAEQAIALDPRELCGAPAAFGHCMKITRGCK